MDISLNLIDLQYLTNPLEMNKITHLQTSSLLIKTDLNFYKKRIFQLTKDMLRGEKRDSNVNKAFENYALACIKYFKFQDKMEIIQKDYEDIKPPVNKNTHFDLVNTNNIIMKKNKPINPKITDHIKIKSTKPVKSPIIPTKRNINLKDPKFREKGLKKKNINK